MKPALVEGLDYYLEDDKMVLTEGYHLRRGFCCNSKCRHCPYRSAPTSANARGGDAVAARSAIDAPIVITGLSRIIKLPR